MSMLRFEPVYLGQLYHTASQVMIQMVIKRNYELNLEKAFDIILFNIWMKQNPLKCLGASKIRNVLIQASQEVMLSHKTIFNVICHLYLSWKWHIRIQSNIERLREVLCLNHGHTSNLQDPDQTRKTFLNHLTYSKSGRIT
jgi:hypothetical protein